jgi:hypothetical protein
MNPKKILAISTFTLLILLCGCTLQMASPSAEPNSGMVDTLVAATMSAFTPSAQLPEKASPTIEQPTSTETIAPSLTNVPTASPTVTITMAPTNTSIPKPGTIIGHISGYPYGALPKLTIVAYGQEPPYNYSYWITAAGDTTYSMTSDYLIPGKYQVVAYDSNKRSGGCPVIVTVISDQSVTCDISNWGGGYPSKPAGVPDP